MTANNLLRDDIFQVATSSEGTRKVSLPRLLAMLGSDSVVCLPGLQCHQEDVFHIFLCYLAGAVLVREKTSSAAQNEDFWLQGILRLDPRGDTGWSLLVDDLSKPAFMQPPLALSKPKLDIKASTSDELDVLQTAKNHDLKACRASISDLEQWTYALISLQTASGFLGQGNYGIARMNGGFGSRPCIELLYQSSPGIRFVRSVQKLLSIRQKLLNGACPYANDGIVLTWMEPWDTEQSLSLTELDPFFLETARVVRLTKRDGKVIALGQATTAARIYTKDLNGVVGDPWTPIKVSAKGKPSSFTPGKAGLTPQLIRELIFEDGFEAAQMQLPDRGVENVDCVFHASVLIRGQGVTEGFHSVNVPVPAQVATNLFSGGASRKSLEQVSKVAIGDAGTVQNKVLGSSLYALLEAGPDRLDFGKREISAWVDKAKKRFSNEWFDAFFPWLWTTIEDSDEDTSRLRWIENLTEVAEEILEDAVHSLPLRCGRAYRAKASALSFFYSAMYKNFPLLKGRKRIDEHSA